MLNHLAEEERLVGRRNAQAAIGGIETGPRGDFPSRRDFLKAAAAAGPTLGALYFGYGSMGDKPAVKAAIIGTGNEGCDAMIRQHNRDYVDFIGYCDARPFNQKRALDHFEKQDLKQYTKADIASLKKYDTIKEVLDDPEVEMIVIALPLWLHAPVAIDAMRKGKHVFCEKLMAHNITECKQMVRAARETNRLLAIGHQRHYSALYENANALVQSGALGDIRHIRASWHRNNGQKRLVKNPDGSVKVDPNTGDYVVETNDQGHTLYYDSWKPKYEEGDEQVDLAKIAYTSLDGKTYAYDNTDELVRWRLYDKTGAGLMAELGSHQLDACSIFLGKKRPIAVCGIGGTFYYDDGRQVDDHVFVNYEFPVQVDDSKAPVGNDRVVVSYSSITTNAFEDYGEVLMGTMGTMMVVKEYDIYLYKEFDRNRPAGWNGRSTAITVEKQGAKPVIETSPSQAGPSAAQALGALAAGEGYPPSRGYREELEHFAYCVRHADESNYHADAEHQPRCPGPVAMADAIIALTSNMAMRQKRRIEFEPAWFDPDSNEVPETSASLAQHNG